MNPLTLGLVLYICPMFFVYHLITRSFNSFSSVIIILFTFQMVPMFLMDEISDYEEDKQCGIRNPCVFYGRKKMEQIEATSARMVVVPCHSCHGQLNSIKAEFGMADLEVKYLWELVADCLILEK